MPILARHVLELDQCDRVAASRYHDNDSRVLASYHGPRIMDHLVHYGAVCGPPHLQER
jgi:hypothetical protein